MEQSFKDTTYKLFWNGIFCNWYQSAFEFEGVKFSCAEQYMMYAKAIRFGDNETAGKILQEKYPAIQKQLGREVKNFNPQLWDVVKYDIVKNGLREKFNQNPELKDYLIKYYGYQIVEASPEDRIWGIGYSDVNAIQNIENWGENLLGKILTELSTELFFDKALVGFALYSSVENMTRGGETIAAFLAYSFPRILGSELNKNQRNSLNKILIPIRSHDNSISIDQIISEIKQLFNLDFCVHDFSTLNREKKSRQCIHCSALFYELDNEHGRRHTEQLVNESLKLS